jgi:hypothetical protein
MSESVCDSLVTSTLLAGAGSTQEEAVGASAS